MMHFYTSIGKYELRNTDGNKHPVVIAGGKKFNLSAHEMLLWSSLLWNVHTHDEIKTIFYEKERDAHILDDNDFEYYLRRLVYRGLVVMGNEIAGIDALYDMIANLKPIPTTGNLFTKIVAFLNLTFKKGLPIKLTKNIFKSENLTEVEKATLHLLKQKNMSTAKLINYLESEDKDFDLNQLKNAKELGRFLTLKVPILKVICNLYFKKLIIFDSI